MAEAKQNFPQIPSTVWWGLREKFKKTVPSKVNDKYLVAQLNVQATAAQQYLRELKKVGLLDEEGKPTEAAKRWRFDDTYREAADEILHTAYPNDLIELAPPGDNDRQKAVRWLMQAADLGEGAARNKAATYFMIGSNEPPSDAVASKSTRSAPRAAAQKKEASPRKSPTPLESKKSSSEPPHNPGSGSADAAMPLNVNVQIHISADATADQIEAIFANMKKYLR